MRVALIDIKGDDARTIDKNSSVNIRNMIELADKIGAKFYYNTAMLDNAKYDVVIFGFGSISTEINKTVEFVKQSGAKAFYWLVGEYEQSMNPALYYCCKSTGVKFSTIQNFTEDIKEFGQYCKGKHFVNINLLVAREANKAIAKKYDCVYYSRWRPDRAKYLKEYLQKQIYFSSDNKNFKQHKHIRCNPKYIKKLTWREGSEELNLFKYSLYLEDAFTHTSFNNLANRWYEAGFCNNVVFFDVNCWNTIRKSEISQFEDQIKDYIVTSHTDLMAKIEYCNQDFEKHLAIQKTWRISEQLLKTQMIDEIKRIINGA
jgi:hypothetical protein